MVIGYYQTYNNAHSRYGNPCYLNVLNSKINMLKLTGCTVHTANTDLCLYIREGKFLLVLKVPTKDKIFKNACSL